MSVFKFIKLNFLVYKGSVDKFTKSTVQTMTLNFMVIKYFFFVTLLPCHFVSSFPCSLRKSSYRNLS